MFIAYALTLMLVQLGKDINDEEIPQQAYPIVFKINSLICYSKIGAFKERYKFSCSG